MTVYIDRDNFINVLETQKEILKRTHVRGVPNCPSTVPDAKKFLSTLLSLPVEVKVLRDSVSLPYKVLAISDLYYVPIEITGKVKIKSIHNAKEFSSRKTLDCGCREYTEEFLSDKRNQKEIPLFEEEQKERLFELPMIPVSHFYIVRTEPGFCEVYCPNCRKKAN